MVAPPKCPRHSATVHCTAVAVGAFCVCVVAASYRTSVRNALRLLSAVVSKFWVKSTLLFYGNPSALIFSAEIFKTIKIILPLIFISPQKTPRSYRGRFTAGGRGLTSAIFLAPHQDFATTSCSYRPLDRSVHRPSPENFDLLLFDLYP